MPSLKHQGVKEVTWACPAHGEETPRSRTTKKTHLGRGDFARANRPDGFVRDDDFTPVRDALSHGVELLGDDLDGLSSFPLLHVTEGCCQKELLSCSTKFCGC